MRKKENYVSKRPVKLAGCGRKINWSLMPRISRDKLKEITSTKELENVMESLVADGTFFEFFKEKEEQVYGVFKQATSCKM